MDKLKNFIYSFLIFLTLVDSNKCIMVTNDPISMKADHIKNRVIQKSSENLSVENSHSTVIEENITTEVMDHLIF